GIGRLLTRYEPTTAGLSTGSINGDLLRTPAVAAVIPLRHLSMLPWSVPTEDIYIYIYIYIFDSCEFY
ncbi:MAG: hypothetical protein KTM48_03615, partial [Wolbachia endosymbiont of Pissodes strobi]|nr:hypothetical protein [Wolbachia endosymbiont of Pissodes strobi]